jgi:hypothetical protein
MHTPIGQCTSDCRRIGCPDAEELMDVLADDQMKHAKVPSDETLDEMFATVGSESQEYRTAH